MARVINLYNRDEFNIREYGALGNGSNDDTSAIQEAIDACIAADGTLIIPSPVIGQYYRITSPLNIYSASKNQLWMNVKGQGHHGYQIVYEGANNSSAVKIIGLKGGIIEGLRVKLGTGVTGTTCIDVGTTVAADSTSCFTFLNCDAELNNGANNKGFRLGFLDEGGGADISQILFANCTAWGPGASNVSGQIGYHIAGHNTLQITFSGGSATFCEKGVSITAGGSVNFFGYGGSNCYNDFHIATSNQFIIQGGRFEAGRQFLKIDGAESHMSVTMTGTMISEYNPTNGRVIECDRPGTIIMDGVKMENDGGDNHGSQMIWLGGNALNPGKGNLHVRGGAIACSSDPFYTVETAANWKIRVDAVGKLDTSFRSASYFTDRSVN